MLNKIKNVDLYVRGSIEKQKLIIRALQTVA